MGVLLLIFLILFAVWVFGGYVTRTTYPWAGNGILAILVLLMILKLFGIL